MTDADKHKVYNIRISLDKGMGATRKSMYFLLDMIADLQGDIHTLVYESREDKSKILYYEDKLNNLKQNAIEALEEL